jgi:hypothetical protein
MEAQSSTLMERRARLESAFFRSEDLHLADRLRIELDEDFDPDHFPQLCGIRDPHAARCIADANQRPENLACLVLAPVLAVAWADRHLSCEERGVILDTAQEFGIEQGSPAFNLMGQWLENRGVGRLADAWVGYVRALCRELTGPERRCLRRTLLKNARKAASAAHESSEFSPISWLRRLRVLKRLDSAFERDESKAFPRAQPPR